MLVADLKAVRRRFAGIDRLEDREHLWGRDAVLRDVVRLGSIAQGLDEPGNALVEGGGGEQPTLREVPFRRKVQAVRRVGMQVRVALVDGPRDRGDRIDGRRERRQVGARQRTGCTEPELELIAGIPREVEARQYVDVRVLDGGRTGSRHRWGHAHAARQIVEVRCIAIGGLIGLDNAEADVARER